jgi:hypothetical protein
MRPETLAQLVAARGMLPHVAPIRERLWIREWWFEPTGANSPLLPAHRDRLGYFGYEERAQRTWLRPVLFSGSTGRRDPLGNGGLNHQPISG